MRILHNLIKGAREAWGWGRTPDLSESLRIAQLEALQRLSRWDRKFLDMAALVRGWSKDRGTKVGCVIVGPDQDVRSFGFNGFPRGVNDANDAWHTRPLKYLATEHAERNALYNAARRGVSVAGCTLYLATSPDKLGPCADCGRGIAQSGIIRVVQEGPLSSREDWKDSCAMARQHMSNAGVQYVILP